MKLLFAACLAVTLAGFAFSQHSGLPTAAESLLDVLAANKVITYSFTQSGNLSARILSETQIRDIRLYYANQASNTAQYDVLMEKKRKRGEELRLQPRPAQDREQEAKILDDRVLAELNREIEKVSNPLKTSTAYEVTHRGADFIGLKSLASGRVVLLPVQAIDIVVVDAAEGEREAAPAE